MQESGRELVDFYPGTTIRIWHNHPATAFPPHRHMALENHMPVENHYNVFVNKKSYRIIPGEILVIPQGELHSTAAPKTGQRFAFLLDISLISKFKSFSGIQPLLA